MYKRQVPSYDVLNLSFQFVPNSAENIAFGLTISNATDEDGVNNIFNNPFGIWSTSREYIPPRQVLGSLRYEFLVAGLTLKSWEAEYCLRPSRSVFADKTLGFFFDRGIEVWRHSLFFRKWQSRSATL